MSGNSLPRQHRYPIHRVATRPPGWPPRAVLSSDPVNSSTFTTSPRRCHELFSGGSGGGREGGASSVASQATATLHAPASWTAALRRFRAPVSKAPEDWRTPRRYRAALDWAVVERHRQLRDALRRGDSAVPVGVRLDGLAAANRLDPMNACQQERAVRREAAMSTCLLGVGHSNAAGTGKSTTLSLC